MTQALTVQQDTELARQHNDYMAVKQRLRAPAKALQIRNREALRLEMGRSQRTSPKPMIVKDPSNNKWVREWEKLKLAKAEREKKIEERRQARIQALVDKDMANAVPLNCLTTEQIQDICLSHGWSDGKTTVQPNQFTRAELLGDRRNKWIVLVRHAAMYFCTKQKHKSYPQLGRKFGGRDHTTLLHAETKMNKLVSELRLYMDDKLITPETELES